MFAARIFSPQMINPKGTRARAVLIGANTVNSQAISSVSSMLSTARGITAPALLQHTASAARAEDE